MEILTPTKMINVSGGSLDRETQQIMVSTFVGIASGGNILAAAIAQWGMGQYYDFQGNVSISESGPISNHLTTRQIRAMRRE
ncbi:hypothetical protein [Alteromonas australica]|uniref:Uncharacterized protein n=1 Tax=Alteromonas australica TaxID=589873 RepID=A0A075NYZ3_9ALTE|nr:hypothetical protein [Alteromonas australica]AIF99869.1 hypothetical protein EP13_14895 [Alteromonas australica]